MFELWRGLGKGEGVLGGTEEGKDWESVFSFSSVGLVMLGRGRD